MNQYPPNRVFCQEYTLVIPEDSLRFNSKFESGNLKKAVKIREKEYNLFLDYDIETKGYTQWFYFSVENSKPGQSIRFNIVNLMKYKSLYNSGMKPLVYSEKSNQGWLRDCSAVSYFKNNIQRPNSKYFYTLTFTYLFKYPFDKIWFSYCYPYTFTELKDYLFSLKSAFDCIRIDTLCKTLAGNSVPVVTITNNVKTYNS